jgi:tetratricopeptide (TPR) repeat protein
VDSPTTLEPSADAEATMAAEGSRVRPPARPLERGNLVGRYVVLERLGVGGMGVVHAAYDPDLDRKVALKLLRPAPEGTGGDDERATARLLREAQAMARLHHPRVITVHDVGTIDGGVFIAMEHLDGGTLGAWCKAAPRSIEEIMDGFVAAGRGLAAAHEAGLVHRDFKPDNVLLGLDGRVCVSDFGLAREHLERETDALDDRSSRGSLAPTGTQGMMGTPAYMSPEQHLGEAADARSDQFSFCVALFEAFAGQRPWTGGSLASLAAAVVEQAPAELPSAVPERVRRAIRRGLARAPEDRWPTMDALLAELTHDPRGGRRRAAWLGASAVVLVALGVAWTQWPRPQVCAGGPSRVAEVWSPSRASALAVTLGGAGPRFAEDTAQTVVSELDAYASAWVDAYREACEATRVLGEQSEPLLDLRMSCLDHRLVALGSMIEVLEQADAITVEKSVTAVGSLPPLPPCADRDALLAAVAPPEDPGTAAAVEAVRAMLTRARALHVAGHYAEAARLVRELLARVEALDYAPVHAEALHVLGDAQGELGELEPSVAALERAFHLAIAGGDDRHAADVATRLGFVDGYGLRHFERGSLWIDHAEALAERTGREPALMARVASTRGILRLSQGQLLESLPELERALELRISELGEDDEAVWKSRSNLAAALAMRGDHARSLSLLEATITSAERRLGPHHPMLATFLTNYANGLSNVDRVADARAALERVLEIRTEAFGPEHAHLVTDLANLGQFSQLEGDLDASERYLQRALELATQRGNELELAMVEARLGNLEARRGHGERARGLYLHALEVFEREGGDPVFIAATLQNLSEEAYDHERWPEVLTWAKRAKAAFERLYGPDTPKLYGPSFNLGRALHELGRASEGVPELERALALTEAMDDPVTRANTAMQLALALHAAGDSSPRARTLAETARALYEQAGRRTEADAAAAWASANR